STADEHRIVVLRPATDWSYEDFRLFYGTADAMIERQITNASRGSSTYITFTMDGASHDVFFPSSLSPEGSVATLTTNGAKKDLTVLDAGSPGAGLSYFCL
ncbi:MAG: hypothetical protein K0S65_3190, partial [Labilithrix sp.]|nr:hypothetical protein [Labilithrix sp.]